MQGSLLSALLVEDSIFASNAVRRPHDAGGVDATVRLYTEGFTNPAASGERSEPSWLAPIWRIDDGRTCSSSLCVSLSAGRSLKKFLHSCVRHPVGALPGGLAIL